MAPFEMGNGMEDNLRRFVVPLKNPQPRLWETEEAHTFVENLRRAQGIRSEHNPPLGTCTRYAQELDQWDILCLPKPENKIKTAHSLGDEGTTVFISEYGELVTFSKFMGLGMLGTVLVEPPILYESNREDEFNDILDGRLPGVGLRLNDRRKLREQKIDYIHDRWPRVSYKTGDLDIKVHFVVHQGVVAQQYLIHNSSQVSGICEFNLDLGFSARPSSTGQWWNNDPRPFIPSSISSTAGGYAAMLWAGDGRGQVQLEVVLFQDGRSVKLNLLNETELSGNDGHAKNSSPYYLHNIKIGPGVTQELTALYSLEKYSLTWEQEQILQPKAENEEDRDSGTKSRDGAGDSHSTRFRSVRAETDGKSSAEMTKEAVVPGLNKKEKTRSNEAETAQEDSFWSYNGDEEQDELMFSIDSEELSKLHADVPNQHFLSPGPSYVDVSMVLKNDYHGKWTLKPEPTNELLRRHLQQLLFVNSVHVPCQNGHGSAIVFSEGHIVHSRIGRWSNFCMFRFLLSMYAFLDRPKVVELGLRDYLKRHIKSTCEKHLDWVFDVARPFKLGWAGDYNLNGSYLKHDARVDGWAGGAFQFVKLHEFCMVFQGLDDRLFVLQKLQKRLGPWIESLERIRDPKSDMWISYNYYVGVDWLDPQYHLDEVVVLPGYLTADLMILWKAFTFIFQFLDANLFAWSLAKSSIQESIFTEMNNKIQSLIASLPENWRKQISPSKLRQKIMDRFTYDLATDVQDPMEPGVPMKQNVAQEGELRGNKDTTENSTKGGDLWAQSVTEGLESNIVRRKRVLAFRWVGNDKPRYLWYSWASRVFESVNSGFFKGDPSSRVWKDTLEAQKVHREVSWEKVSRYALALRAARHGQSLDMTMNAEQMRRQALERLLKCFYSNGTFPTRLDLSTKQPMSKGEDYDLVQSTFEILLQLLEEETECSNIAAAMTDKESGDDNYLFPPEVPTIPAGATITNVRVPDRNIKDKKFFPEDGLDFDPEAVRKERARLAKSATHFARSTKYDRANIHDPPDFEPDWLFPYADCFSSVEPTETDEETMLVHQEAKRAVDELRQMSDGTEEPAYRVLRPGIEMYCSARPEKDAFAFSKSVPSVNEEIFDIGQSSHAKTSGQSRYSQHFNLEYLLRRRTWKSAKKRIIIVDACQPEQALLLYLGSAESEKLSTAGFLTRHRMRDNFMWDHAHKNANLWTTELHLSFYKTVIVPSDQDDSTPTLERSIFEDPEMASAFPGEPKVSSKRLQKGAIGWRFTGDLHDRRWTGTILVFVPGKESDSHWVTRDNFLSDKGFHGQRKIIEALLFSQMVKTIHVSTTEVLRDLSMLLDEGDDGIYKGSSEHHDPLSESFDQSYSRSKLYLQLSDFLGHLEDSLKGNVETIEKYMDREKQRPVQPRWSVADERKHRPELRKWDQEGRRNIAILLSVRDQVRSKSSRVQHLRESLNADMQLREARLQARSAEDVRLFTYVTIVFLPISFSSSIFSMQQAPGNSLIGNFAKVAVIALVITLVILFNLKTMSRSTWKFIDPALHRISYTMSISSWAFWRSTHEDLVQAEKRNIQSHEPLQSRRVSKWWYCLFVLAFVFVELPEKRVRKAYDVNVPPVEDDAKPPTLLRKIQRVVLGLLFFPLYFVAYAVLSIREKIIHLYQPSSKGARPADEMEESQTQGEYDGGIAELTHPAGSHGSSVAGDASNIGAIDHAGDADTEKEGAKQRSASSKTRIMSIVNKLGWQAPSATTSRTMGNDHV